jgi:hypothetical protein
MLVPVVDSVGTPLQPAIWPKVRRWIKEHRCYPKKRRGIFYVQLKKTVEEPNVTEIYVGIDPGSKMTGITVASDKGVIANYQLDATSKIKEKLETRAMYRRQRRYRKTPYRPWRGNRRHSKSLVPPSTKARWDRYLNLIQLLSKLLNVTDIAVEDIQAKTWKHARRWNVNFSPIEVGKNYFYGKILESYELHTFEGWQTKNHRDQRGFSKSKKKLDTKWNCHCVDSHSLIEMAMAENIEPKETVKFIKYPEVHRRELFKERNGRKERYGGTRSLGYNKGSLVWHPKYKLCLAGGNTKGLLTVNSLENGKRLCQYCKLEDIKLVSKRYGINEK